jgi:hypothetical protein
MKIELSIDDLEKLFAEAVERGINIEEQRIHDFYSKGKKIEDVLVHRGFCWRGLGVRTACKNAKKEAKEMIVLMKEQIGMMAK